MLAANLTVADEAPLAGGVGEQDAESYGKVRHHLDECAPCLRQYGLEQAVKALVARSCGGDPAPAELRERVMIRIQEVRLEIEHVEFRVD